MFMRTFQSLRETWPCRGDIKFQKSSIIQHCMHNAVEFAGRRRRATESRGKERERDLFGNETAALSNSPSTARCVSTESSRFCQIRDRERVARACARLSRRVASCCDRVDALTHRRIDGTDERRRRYAGL